jgi:hypothetical protein
VVELADSLASGASARKGVRVQLPPRAPKEVQMSNGTRLSIDCTSVENELADNMYQRRELDYLIYNDPAAYADLILNGDPEKYLREVTIYENLDN